MSLLSLPKELRLIVFEALARSTVINFPYLPEQRNPHPLAISQTCRLIHSEANSLLFLRHSTLECHNTVNVLDVLTSLSEEQLGSVRYLEFAGTPIVLHQGSQVDLDKQNYTVYAAQAILELFPGLRLNTLIYHDPYHGPSKWVSHSGRHFGDYQAYDRIDKLVNSGIGWDQLHYISSNTAFLQTINRADSPQPSTWDNLLKIYRDGVESGASVEIFVAKKEYSGVVGVASNPNMREPFDEAIFTKEVAELMETEDENLAHYRNGKAIPKREVLVFVRRGKGAVERDALSLPNKGSRVNTELKKLFEQQSWKVIKEERLGRLQVPGPTPETEGRGY